MKLQKMKIFLNIEALEHMDKNKQQKYPIKIFGAGFDLFLKLCAIFFSKDYVNIIHEKAPNSISFSPVYVDFKNNMIWFEFNLWDEFGHTVIRDLKNKLLNTPDPCLDYNLLGISVKLVFSEHIENSQDCFWINVESLDQTLERKCKMLTKVTIRFNTPFFIKLNNFNYSFPEKDIVINSLLKNYGFSDSDILRQNLIKILPINYDIKLEKVEYSQQKMHGCVGYITYDISSLSDEAKILLTKALIISSFRGIGAKRVHGFGNISVFLNGQQVNLFLSNNVK